MALPEGVRVREGKRGKTYQARVMVAGKAQAKSFKTLAQARQWIAEVRHNGSPSYVTQFSNESFSIQEAIERFISESTDAAQWARSRKRAYRLLITELGEFTFDSFTAEHVVQFAQRRRAGLIPYCDPVGPSTVQSEISYLNVVWRRAVERYGVKADHALVTKAMRWLRADGVIGDSERRDRRPTQHELAMLREYWRGSNQLEMPLVDMLDFTLLTCVRRAELVGLRWEDFVDGPEPRILVRDRKDPKRKNNHMWLPLIGESAAIIRRQPRTSDRIFPYSESSISHRMWVTCTKLGIKGLSWHCFRHEGISRKFELGWSIPQVAQMSGHRTWENLQRYTHLSPSSVHHLPC